MPCPKCSQPSIEGAAGLCAVHLDEQRAQIAKVLGPRKSEPAKPLKMGAIVSSADQVIRKAADIATPKGRAPGLYCPSCGTVSNGQRHVPGSIAVEIILWLCFLVPGIIYSIWRLSAAKKACTACKAVGLIPVSSPRAQRELGSG